MDKQNTIGALEMAQRLGVSPATVYNYINAGRIPSARVRRGMRFRLEVLRSDFEAVAAQLASGEFDKPKRNSEGQQNPSLNVAFTTS